MRKPSRLVLVGIALVCATIIAACSDSRPRVTSVTVAPVNGEIYVSAAPAGGVRSAARAVRPGTSNLVRRPEVNIPAVTASCHPLQYTATATFSNKATQDVSNSSDTTWTSSSTSVASISATGLATGVGPGTTNISASYKGVSSAGEPLAVDQLNSISVSPSLVTLTSGAAQPYVAIGHFTLASGNSSDFDVSSQITWDSTDKTVATIDNSGNATAAGTGSTTITATSCDGTIVGHATLNVSSPTTNSLVVTPTPITISTGTTTLFTAMEKLPDGTIQAVPAGTVITWSSDTTSVVSITAASATMATAEPNSAVALGIRAGLSNITATASNFNPGSAVVTVQAAAARFAYVGNGSGNGGSGSISGYSVGVIAGTLTPLTGSPFNASSPQQVLIHPSGDFMYYIDSNGSVHVEDIDTSSTPTGGSLTDSGQAPVPATATVSATHVGVIDPLGRFLYVITDADSKIYGFSITQTGDKDPATNGTLTGISSVTGYTDATLGAPTWIMTDRSGKYLYVVNNDPTIGNSISEYSIDQSTGALTQLGTPSIATGNSPLFGTTDANGHLYVANDGTAQSVSIYSIDTSTGSTAGELTKVGSDFPVAGATFAINVLTDPTGKYLYVLDSISDTAGQVFAYTLDTSSGAVVGPIGATGQPTGGNSTGMAIDPTGVFMAIDNNATSSLSLFNVSPSTGALAPATPATATTDVAPQFVVFYSAAPGQ